MMVQVQSDCRPGHTVFLFAAGDGHSDRNSNEKAGGHSVRNAAENVCNLCRLDRSYYHLEIIIEFITLKVNRVFYSMICCY